MRNKFIIIFIICLQLWVAGCVRTEIIEYDEAKTKAEILQIIGKPAKVYTQPSKLKYGADEMWLYNGGCSDEYLYYFKDGVVIKRERRIYDTL